MQNREVCLTDRPRPACGQWDPALGPWLHALLTAADVEEAIVAGLALARAQQNLHRAGPPPEPELPLLRPREQTVLQLIAAGMSNKEIARVLGIAPETVKTHLKHLYLKLGVQRRTQAMARAEACGLLPHGAG